MESDSLDKYESDNLIWQLEITLSKLAAICKKNGKLVDYINKKVTKTVSDWNNEKDNFKKLSWAEMDDSDLDLDLDIILSQNESEGRIESEGRTDDAAANPDPLIQSASLTDDNIDTADDIEKDEGIMTGENKEDSSELIIIKKENKIVSKKKKKNQRMFVRWRQKLEETEKFEILKLEKMKEEQRLRMKRAEQRVFEHHLMVKSKNAALKFKLKEIETNKKIETENIIAAIRERQIKAEKKKEEIKTMRRNLNKRHENAANKRDRYHHNNNYRRNSLSLSQSESILNDNDLNRLSGKFLYIPRIVRKSSSSDLYGNIENLYRNTSHLLLLSRDSPEISTKLSSILKIWIKKNKNLDIVNPKYNKDVLLVMNRLICFDLNCVSIPCTKLMISSLLNLSKNKNGTELLSLKYSLKLLLFARNALNEYFFAQNNDFESILPQIMRLLLGIFECESSIINSSDREYKKFKKETLSSLLLNVITSSFLIKISSVFHLILFKECNDAIIDAMLNILIQITLILAKHDTHVCHLISNQLFESTQCTFVIDFIYRNKNDIKKSILSKCLQFLINLTKYNKRLMTKIWNLNREKFYVIITTLCEFICNINNKNINKNIANNIFNFISISTINNKSIQDLFDAKLITNLCNNVAFYFVLQKNGQNLLFPALIAISLNHEENLKAITESSLNIKHLKKYIQRNKTQSKYWSNCCRFYSIN